MQVKIFGQDISVIINEARYRAIDEEIQKFADKWFLSFEDVKYEAYNYRKGILQNETKLKEQADYTTYKTSVENSLPKFMFYSAMVTDFHEGLMEDIEPLFA